jgi:lipoate-protein ligase A
MKEWRLLDTGCLTAAENMALDDVLLECRARNTTPNTVRFLRFDPPAVLVGFHQTVEHQVREEFCEMHGIDVNRRLTGGGTIYFEKESLGWEVIASKQDLGMHHPMFFNKKLFKMMCEGVIHGLRSLGVEAEFKSRNDIEVNGKKISGTGGTERDGAFLFQGTLLIDFDADTMFHSLKIPVEKLKDKEIESVKERVTCIKWVLGSTPELDDVKRALKEGFEKVFDVKLVEQGLTREEEELLRNKLDLYKSREWIYDDRTPLDEVAEVHAVKKTQGGLVRVSLTLGLTENMIRNARITGDFFIFPSRAILDLETRLMSTSCEELEIRNVVKAFFETGVHIPGVTPEDLIGLIIEAASKTKYQSCGVSLQEANHIYTINTHVESLLGHEIDVLLLPYCSKLVSCKFRYVDGCAGCGKCTIGDAYSLAEEHGLTPITIQNFEHLMETLEAIKRNGARGYLGCCCEGFYSKHRDDLESINLPGVLIDIDDQTCYDLGKEEEALEGAFESQTSLRIELLRKLIENISAKKIQNA